MPPLVPAGQASHPTAAGAGRVPAAATMGGDGSGEGISGAEHQGFL